MRTRRCRSRETLAYRWASGARATARARARRTRRRPSRASDSTSKVRPRTAPTIADNAMTPSIARSTHPSSIMVGVHSVSSTALRPAALALASAASASPRDANGPTRTRMRLPAGRLRDLGVGLEAELLDVLARLARRLGVGEGADLDDEALLVGARRRPAFEQRAGALAVGRRARRRRRRGRGDGAARGAARRLRRRRVARPPATRRVRPAPRALADSLPGRRRRSIR